MKAPVPLLALTLLAGCANTLEARGVEGPVRIGQIAYADGLRVRPDRLIEDSRCAAGTKCVWAGRVVVRATVYLGSGSSEIDLILGTHVPIADGQLTLVAVQPERGDRARPDPRDYLFTFAFEGGF